MWIRTEGDDNKSGEGRCSGIRVSRHSLHKLSKTGANGTLCLFGTKSVPKLLGTKGNVRNSNSLPKAPARLIIIPLLTLYVTMG